VIPNQYKARQLAYALYSTSRLVNAENVKLLSDDLMVQFLQHGSDTWESMNVFAHIEYGTAPKNPNFPNPLRYYGLKLRDYDVLVSDVIRSSANTAPEGRSYLPLHLREQIFRIAALILEAFEVVATTSIQDLHPLLKLKRSARTLSYKLFTLSHAENDLDASHVDAELQLEFGDFGKYIEYGSYPRSDTMITQGLIIRGSEIPITEYLLDVSEPPIAVAEHYPYLGKQGSGKNIPDYFKRNHLNKGQILVDWEELYQTQFPNLWYAVIYATTQVLNAFERYVRLQPGNHPAAD
jgi:hypothetical protein